MPRPRSSTFYLPLAPIDAPLELKAKLSVLPPSAANALLAPRNNSYGGISHPHHGFSRSGTTTTTTGVDIPSCSSSGPMYNTPEDECTRLNRVLGIPTPSLNTTHHTHITLPQTGSNIQHHHQQHACNPTPTAALNVPTPAGRRRHTDAPRPSFPLTRSPLIPTPIPSSEHATTGYFPVQVPAAPANWSVAPNPTPISTGPASASLSQQQHQNQPTPSSGLSSIPETASISDNQHGNGNDRHPSVVQTTLSVTAKATTTDPVTDKEADDEANPLPQPEIGNRDDNGGDHETEMAWTCDADDADNDDGDFADDVEHGFELGVQIGHGAVDMDMFAGACEVQNPVVLASPTHSPRPSISSPPRTPVKPLEQTPKPLERTPPLSCIPCGMHDILACMTKTRSRFAPSPPPSSRPSTAISSSRPSTSTSRHTPIVVLTPKLAIRPPPSDSLHPNDTRHLLRPQFRLSFPPPPAPLPLAKDTHPREEACMFVDESIPGLADINASFLPTAQDPSTSASASQSAQQPTQHSFEPTAKVAPRQRFRLAPLYLPKVLRRSLGATAWARSEALRAARAAERAFGWAVPLNLTPGTEPWESSFGNAQGALGNWVGGSTGGGAWWGRVSDEQGRSECTFGNSLVWSGYEDVYSEEGDEDMDMLDLESDEEAAATEECLWDWDDEDVQPVLVQGQQRQGEEMDEDEFVREGAPEPEERPSRPSPGGYSPQSSPSFSIQTPSTPSEPAGYSMVGKFGWNTTWPASPTSPISPTNPERAHFQSINNTIPALDGPPVTLGLPPVPRRSLRREDGAESEEEEEEIFRYSPLKVEDDQVFYGQMDVEEGDQDDVQIDYLHTQSLSSCSTPTATSPSFPPEPLRGVAISSSFDDGYLADRVCTGEQVQACQEFYDADGDAEMEEVASPRNAILSRPPIRAPRPLSLVQHPVLHHQYHEDAPSPPPNRVFIIPPSPLTTSTFDAGSGAGSSTPTSATAPALAPAFPDRMEEEGDLSNVGWPTASVGHGLSSRRSYERIVAPRPQRASRGMEQVFTASTSSPVYRASSLAQSPPPASPPSSSSPQIPSTSSPRWTFGSLKSALSNSMSHLVELARSRSPSPLPWLIRGSTGYTGATLSGVAAALDASNSSHRRDGSEEELDSERSTSCVTPTPTASSHSRRSSTTTITGASSSHLPVLKLQVDNPGVDAMMSESPPPKRTLSTSSLSSLGSEPDSESGSSGGIFSRSPSPEPSSDSRIWDPSYTLTPRSRPISADAKAAAACGGRLSPMMIPGSWDPAELWAEEGDLANTW